MSKKKQPVEVAIDEVTLNGADALQVSIKDQVVGTIQTTEKGFEAQVGDDRPVKVKSQDEGVEYLIQAYNLHH